MRIQKGLRTSRKPGVTLARYQESRIRHFHATLDSYMGVGTCDEEGAAVEVPEQ
jgi:hypothetical protein